MLQIATERMLKLSNIRNQTGKNIYVGIKPKINTILRLEEYLGKSIWEVVIQPELVSTHKSWEIARVIKLLENKQYEIPGLIFINLSTYTGYENSEQLQVYINQLAVLTEQMRIPMMIFTDSNIQKIGEEEDWDMEKVSINALVGWESPYMNERVPTLEDETELIRHYSLWGWTKEGPEEAINKIFRHAAQKINNMYKITADMSEYWQCPVCALEGYKINQHFGYCVKRIV